MLSAIPCWSFRTFFLDTAHYASEKANGKTIKIRQKHRLTNNIKH